ncbi:MAG TPA: glycine zipper 2TM domain-containing protein [Verrucomicrobiae bacterium]|nr:glycine zipper 2TM domain-containing protein [Verrucomicrobiae bacterium]
MGNPRTGLTKSTALAAALGMLIGAPAALASPRHKHHDRYDHWDYARVVDVDPIYRDVRVREPREVCTEEPVTERVVHRGHAHPGAMLFGAVVGGVIGHQFGGGRGQDVATAAGAVIGASHAANRTDRGDRVTERTVYETRCERVHETRYVSRIEGYDVTYRYNGRLFYTRTDEHPGSRIRVRVDAEPRRRH